MVSRFIRKPEVIALSGLSYTTFHTELQAGRFPKPDAYLGPRSPVWLETTIVEWQRAKLEEPAQPKMQTPRRKRCA
jgi:predicted DNA-binding transcriptional regulator AlpA